jgi:DNA-binding CsgD family transcriptional regulator
MHTSPGASPPNLMASTPVTSLQTQTPALDPFQVKRILTLTVAHWSYGKIVDLGRYQGTWTEQDVMDVLERHKRRVPGMPGSSDHATLGGRPIPMNPLQRSIVTLLLEDTSDEDIAWELDVSVKLIRKHIRAICNRAELRDRISLVLALTNGRIRAVDLDESHD